MYVLDYVTYTLKSFGNEILTNSSDMQLEFYNVFSKSIQNTGRDNELKESKEYINELMQIYKIHIT